MKHDLETYERVKARCKKGLRQVHRLVLELRQRQVEQVVVVK